MRRNPRLNYHTLPMENAYNVRDLGGYAAQKGSITKYHEFLRTDELTNITEADKKFLLQYGLKAVIDLRGEAETVRFPCPFQKEESVAYINLPFITDTVLDMRMVREKGFDPKEFYVNLVEYKDMVANIIRFITKFEKGCVLFHCQAGKDRTGVVAMILLGICGVSKEDILANYQVSYTYLKDHVKLRNSKGLEVLQYSKFEWIETAYDHIIDTYGTFENYLLKTGLDKKDIRFLRKKLVRRSSPLP